MTETPIPQPTPPSGTDPATDAAREDRRAEDRRAQDRRARDRRDADRRTIDRRTDGDRLQHDVDRVPPPGDDRHPNRDRDHHHDYDHDSAVPHHRSGSAAPARNFADLILGFVWAVPAVCFTGALLSDIAYRSSAAIQWTNFSQWLLAFGMIFAVLAAGVSGAAAFAQRGHGRFRDAWPFALGVAVVLVLALWNNFVHTHDGWTSVVPTGLTLSVLTVLAMIVTGTFATRIAPATDMRGDRA